MLDCLHTATERAFIIINVSPRVIWATPKPTAEWDGRQPPPTSRRTSVQRKEEQGELNKCAYRKGHQGEHYEC